MSHRSELLEHERRKLTLLRNKLAEQEQRVKVLEQMQDDPLDALLEQELAIHPSMQTLAQPDLVQLSDDAFDHTFSAAKRQVEASIAAANFWQRTPRRIPQKWVTLLSFLGQEGKTFPEVEQFITEFDLGLSPGGARAGLMNYRKDFGLVESPRKGFYKVTEKGLSLLRAQKDESLATGHGEALESQPTSLARAEA